MDPAENIRELAEPALSAAGLELWDVEVGRGLVRVLVDRPGGVDLDALSDASAAISPLLDEHDDLVPDGHYQLEVSSPGVERTLRTPAQYRRYLGELVAVKTVEAVGGARRMRGKLASVDDDGIELAADTDVVGDRERVGDSRQPSVRIRYSQIQRAHTVLLWGPAPKPSGPPRKPAKADDRSTQTNRTGVPASTAASGSGDRKDAAL
jgi:ribosome maturation factor RimP